MVGKCKKKGIMGGTFDPIHIGHLILGENACLQLGLDSILFMPSGTLSCLTSLTGLAEPPQCSEWRWSGWRLRTTRIFELSTGGNP